LRHSSSSSNDNSKSNSNGSVRAAQPLLEESNVEAKTEQEQIEPAAASTIVEQSSSRPVSTSSSTQQHGVRLGSLLRGAVERLKDEKFHANSISYSWSPDDRFKTTKLKLYQHPKLIPHQ
jgi:hypothetical protein